MITKEEAEALIDYVMSGTRFSPWKTPGEAARYLKMNPWQFVPLHQQGIGPRGYIGSDDILRYHVDDLDEWMKGQTTTTLIVGRS